MPDLNELQKSVNNALSGCTLSDAAKLRLDEVFDRARGMYDERDETNALTNGSARMREGVGIGGAQRATTVLPDGSRQSVPHSPPLGEEPAKPVVPASEPNKPGKRI